MNSLDKNKQAAISFYKDLMGQRNTELAQTLIAEDYIQHNPMVPTGRAGVLGAIEFLKQLPPNPNPKNPIKRVFGEGNLVVLHLDVEMPGMRKAVIDIFRVENGQLKEHWDAMEDQPAETASGNEMTDGKVEIEDHDLKDENKAVIKRFYEEVWVKGNGYQLSEFASIDLIQHHPEIENGLIAWENHLKNHSNSITRKTPARIIAEGNFVLTQASGILKDQPFVFYDIFRLKDGKIVETWSVRQMIPEKMAHSNGMI